MPVKIRQKQQRYRKKIQRTYKNLQEGSKRDEKVGCVVTKPDHKFIKRLKPQNTFNSAEEDSFSTLMAVEGDINSKKPKTLSLRKLLDKERGKVTLLWVPGYIEIPGNYVADEEA
jgi:hypothetical protein